MFKQSRTVSCIVYDLDDINSFIEKFRILDYAYIYHDKDKNKDGTIKPPHYHLYCKRKSPIVESSLKSFVKTCKQNFFYENIKSNSSGLLRYFLHIDNDEKFHYEEEEIVSNFDVSPYLDNSISSTSDKVNPSDIITLYEQGYTTLQVIKQFPKLIYSIASLQRYERLLIQSRFEDAYIDKKLNLQQISVVTPFDDVNDVF